MRSTALREQNAVVISETAPVVPGYTMWMPHRFHTLSLAATVYVDNITNTLGYQRNSDPTFGVIVPKPVSRPRTFGLTSVFVQGE